MKYIICISLNLFTTVTAFSNVNLDNAFKRELIFLKSQLRELEKQKKNLVYEYDQKQDQARKEVQELRGKLVNLNLKNQSLEQSMSDIERTSLSIDEIGQNIENILGQYQKEVKKEYSENNLKNTFDFMLNKVEQGRSIRKEKDSFFNLSGEKELGEILYIGEIAAFGKAHENVYQLAPAGNNLLKVWNKSNLSFQNPQEIFLYQNKNKDFEKRKEQTVFEFIQAGGAIAWIIVAMGIFALLLCFLRIYSLKVYSKATTFALKGEIPPAHKLTQGFGNLIHEVREGKDLSEQKLADLIDEGMIDEHKKIDRYSTVILVFAAIAPLMGLLGTVTGMISTFDIITEFGTGDPKLLSKGISEALITTELGLIVAIPTLLFGNVLSGFGKNLKMNVDQVLLGICNKEH